MRDDQERGKVLAEDASKGEDAEKEASAQERAARLSMEIAEGDHSDRRELNAERLREMRQTRKIRQLTFYWVMLPLLALSSFALLALGVAAARYGFVDIVQGSEDGGAMSSPWPKVVFISGTFLTFIFVFGALVKGVFASPRREGEDSHRDVMAKLPETIARNSGE